MSNTKGYEIEWFSSGRPFKELWNWTKTLYGYLKIKLSILMDPETEELQKKMTHFAKFNADVLLKTVKNFVDECHDKSNEEIAQLLTEHDRKWRKYAARVNKFSKTFKLLPDAFLTQIKERPNPLKLEADYSKATGKGVPRMENPPLPPSPLRIERIE